jgi:hypothetical protein
MIAMLYMRASNTYVFRDVSIKRVLQPMGNNAIKIDHVFENKEILKSAPKPRTVSLEGGEDDADTTGTLVVPPLLSSKISSNRETRYESKMQKYVVPALRHKKIMCATEQRGILGVKPVPYATEGRWSYALPIERNNIITNNSFVCSIAPQIVPQEKVKPMFRTPCHASIRT